MAALITTIVGCACSSTHIQSAPASEVRFDRVTLVVENMDPSLSFWRDVMGFKLVIEPKILPPHENQYYGWSENAEVAYAKLDSLDGANIGLLSIEEEGYPNLDIRDKPTAFGGVILVHISTNIEALNERAVQSNAIIKPLGFSRTGQSKQVYIKSPSGHMIEVYQLLPK